MVSLRLPGGGACPEATSPQQTHRSKERAEDPVPARPVRQAASAQRQVPCQLMPADQLLRGQQWARSGCTARVRGRRSCPTAGVSPGLLLGGEVG